jgi:starvation-inducible outer membrane lipoprotein
MAKCTLVNRVDSKLEFPSFKLLDIIYSGGNPVLHDGDDDKFIADVKGALDGKCFRDKFISRQEIISNHTNHDRMSEIFGKIGLNKISQMILNSKGI